MNDETRDKWDAVYDARDVAAAEPARVLVEYVHLLPKSGQALEVACGRGGNAVYLARHGLQVTAWDISPVVVDKLRHYAEQQQLDLHAAARDLRQHPPIPGSFDVIVVTHFLDRSLIPALIDALRPGGLMFYQTFTRSCVSAAGPSNPEFRLADNELLVLFGGFRLLAYRDEGRVGDLGRGFRDLALIVAQKI
ncbi:MAG: methyltransferase domain-containing protein [Gammaproteobacteria bacterium]|nr:methyltransferase domain-containing protein [Gammaproteobacteria bacterium]